MTIEHNGLLVGSAHENGALDALIAWFSERSAEADELHVSGSLLSVPEPCVEGNGLGRSEIVVPSYCVELGRLSPSDGDLYPALSANARQQLRRAIRYFERSGPLQLRKAGTVAEARTFFEALKELHSASWQQRGWAHSFTRAFFEPYHQLLIDRSFAAGGIELLRASAGDVVIGYL